MTGGVRCSGRDFPAAAVAGIRNLLARRHPRSAGPRWRVSQRRRGARDKDDKSKIALQGESCQKT